MQKLYLQRSQAVAFSYLKEWKRTTISVLPLTRLSPIRSSISILFCSLTFPLADGPFQSKWERQQSPYIRCHGACSCKAIWDHKNYISWRHLHCTIYPSPVYLQVKCIYSQFFLHRTFFCSFLCSHLCPRTLHQKLHLLPLPAFGSARVTTYLRYCSQKITASPSMPPIESLFLLHSWPCPTGYWTTLVSMREPVITWAS